MTVKAAFYNEIDHFVAQWLRNLIAAGHLPPGDVEERSIADLTAKDLKGHEQAHFFAGIGGWPLALRLAGWATDRPVWTGSCPCQPLSCAGKRRGANDERHLWPAFFRLIRESRPPVVFGEQVASPDGLVWLDAVRADLEAEGYAFGAADLPACGAGAPHKRGRIYFVADAARLGRDGSGQARSQGRAESADGGVVDVPVPKRMRLRGAGRKPDAGEQPMPGAQPQPAAVFGVSSPWVGTEARICTDGKLRPIKSGLLPMAHGFSGRVAAIEAYGDAIVPQVAALFIRAYSTGQSKGDST